MSYVTLSRHNSRLHESAVRFAHRRLVKRKSRYAEVCLDALRNRPARVATNSGLRDKPTGRGTAVYDPSIARRIADTFRRRAIWRSPCVRARHEPSGPSAPIHRSPACHLDLPVVELHECHSPHAPGLCVENCDRCSRHNSPRHPTVARSASSRRVSSRSRWADRGDK
jgi:hypothetical protein